MALKSGLAGQIGFVTETTVGVAKAPTIFIPLQSDGLEINNSRLESEAIIANRLTIDSSHWAPGMYEAGGDLGFELYNRGATTLFRHMFGGKSTSGSDPYTHTFTPQSLDGLGLCPQVGVPDAGTGTVHPKTLSGAKIVNWQIACTAGEYASLGITTTAMFGQIGSRVVTDGATTNNDKTVTSLTAAFTAADVGKSISGTGIPTGAYIVSINSSTSVEISANATATATSVSITIGLALGSATMPDGLVPYTFVHGSVTIGGSAVRVKAIELSGDNGLKTDRNFVGSAWSAEALGTSRRSYGGSMDLEFTDLAQHNRFMAGDEVALVLAFAAGADSLTITCNVRYDSAPLNVSGTDIVTHPIGFQCVGATDAQAITAVMVNSDSSAD